MKHNLYSIYDTASGLYSQAGAEISDGSAKRAFSNLATNLENPIGKHPKDYTLIRIGTFNDVTGELKDEQNRSMITALEAIGASRNVDKQQMEIFDNEIPTLVQPGTNTEDPKVLVQSKPRAQNNT